MKESDYRRTLAGIANLLISQSSWELNIQKNLNAMKITYIAHLSLTISGPQIPAPSLKAIDSMTHVDPAACVICQLLNGRLGSPIDAPVCGMWVANLTILSPQEGQTYLVIS